jgi:hypothetical protein
MGSVYCASISITAVLCIKMHSYLKLEVLLRGALSSTVISNNFLSVLLLYSIIRDSPTPERETEKSKHKYVVIWEQNFNVIVV